MRISYIGNHSAPHSTESHVAQAIEANGWIVDRVQENTVDWYHLHRHVADTGADLVLWTHTRDYAPKATWDGQCEFLRLSPVPVVGYHLDLWFGLARAHLVTEEPYFQVDLLITADGGHPKEWEQAKVNHRWLPPGVSEFECGGGTYRDELASPVAFVGSWRPGYHPESRHRADLVRWLQHNYRGRVRFWPAAGEPAVRGDQLRDVYASTGVAVGDSCLTGTGLTRYWSDRISESVGRGACFLHPYVDGLTEHYTPGVHMDMWRAGNWDELQEKIDYYLTHPEEARAMGEAGRQHTLLWHTYTVRVRQIVDLVRGEGLIP